MRVADAKNISGMCRESVPGSHTGAETAANPRSCIAPESHEIAALLDFFRVLDRWDRETHDAEVM